jgi:hypothetical protein
MVDGAELLPKMGAISSRLAGIAKSSRTRRPAALSNTLNEKQHAICRVQIRQGNPS